MRQYKTNWQRAKEGGIEKIISVTMPRDLAERLTNHSIKSNIPRTQVIRTAALEYLDRQQA